MRPGPAGRRTCDAPWANGPRWVATGAGFTLIELVVVIVIIGIVSAVLGLFVSSPIRGFIDQSRRSALTDAADLALLRMARDLRSALPNSVRSSADGKAIEMLLTLDGERYRVEPPGGEDDRLTPGVADSAFNTLAPLGGSDGIPAGARLAVYPLGEAPVVGTPGVPGTRPYVDDVLTPAGMSITRSVVTVGAATESRLTLGGPHLFPFDSPSHRVFLVEGPVSYLCSGGRLLRYAGYALQSSQPTSASALNGLAAPAVIAEGVDEDGCSLRYSNNANSRRSAVARLEIVLELQDEDIRLQRQVHVDNSP